MSLIALATDLRKKPADYPTIPVRLNNHGELYYVLAMRGVAEARSSADYIRGLIYFDAKRRGLKPPFRAPGWLVGSGLLEALALLKKPEQRITDQMMERAIANAKLESKRKAKDKQNNRVTAVST